MCYFLFVLYVTYYGVLSANLASFHMPTRLLAKNSHGIFGLTHYSWLWKFGHFLGETHKQKQIQCHKNWRNRYQRKINRKKGKDVHVENQMNRNLKAWEIQKCLNKRMQMFRIERKRYWNRKSVDFFFLKKKFCFSYCCCAKLNEFTKWKQWKTISVCVFFFVLYFIIYFSFFPWLNLTMRQNTKKKQ